jgi:uncharacterized protein (TIGR02271 family)
MESDIPGTYDGWINSDVYDRNGDKVGEIKDVYYDDATHRPEWLAIDTGMFGQNLSFVPIAGSTIHEDDLWLAYDKDQIKDAPNCDADGHLSPEEERALYSHYEFSWGERTATGYGYGVGYDQARADEEFATGWSDDDSRDDAMTRSEEELRVSTERQEAGRVRLRKYVVTEQQQMTVPVSREEVRVEREPITDENVDQATSGPDIAESEHEIVTHEERPVVSKETVPKERVRLETETVTDQETVTGDVRKEQIEVEGDVDGSASSQEGRQ